MNNQPDPAVEGALVKAEKLINREPQLRRKLRKDLLITSATLLILVIAGIIFPSIRSHIFNAHYCGMLYSLLMIAGFSLGIYFFLVKHSLAYIFKKSIFQKLIITIKNESMESNIQPNNMPDDFSDEEKQILKNLSKTWIGLILEEFINAVIISIMVFLLLNMISFVFMACFDTSYGNIGFVQIITAAILFMAGIAIGCVTYITLRIFIISLIDLFFQGHSRMLIYATLLKKIRIVKADCVRKITDE